ncbi:MAG: hypothetical protein EHM79_18705 [Geobacter sp.]|nr:MAG: hypothetical protein EHM79_18705 [Geobacter sp.]
MRIKWFDSDFNNSNLALLKGKMLHSDYELNDTEGFRLEKASPHALSGKYIVKRQEVNVSTDPFGREYSYTSLEYDVYRFNLSLNHPSITLIDSPRSVNPFFTRLTSLSGFDIQIKPVEIDVMNAIAELERVWPSMRVIKVTSGNITLSPTVMGKFVISGTEEVRSYISNFVVSNDISLDKAKVFNIKNNIVVEISRNGLAHMVGRLIPDEFIAELTRSIFKNQP